MPIYEYRCQSCGEHLEKMQGMSEDPLTLCPECGEEALKRLISQTSFRLKGSGWYVTDYANKGKGKDSSGDGSGSKDASSKPSSDAGKSSSDSGKSSSSSSDAA